MKVIGVRFRTAGKIYSFISEGFDLDAGDKVIVETIRGVEYGKVVYPPRDVSDEAAANMKPVIRKATPEDDIIMQDNVEKSRKAFKICKEKIAKHGLVMKLISSEYTFDGSKLLFYFTADGRVDFRELVKDLASVFRTRIELRQVGVRDETKMLGGIGVCGRPLCCNTYLSEFVPVSIKMAKEQDLSLNPTKISGICGRLMCCLKNEQEAYEHLNSNLPSVGEMVKTRDGKKGVVTSINTLRQLVKIVIEENDEREIKEYSIEELKFKPQKRKFELATEELRDLQGLEDSEGSKLED